MDALIMAGLAKAGAAAAMSFGAVGSAVGTGTAGMSAIGAWKKCFAQNKAAPFLLLVFIGAPLTQTIYGMILMNALIGAADIKTYLSAEVISAAEAAAAAAQSAAWLDFVPAELLAAAKESLAAVVINWPQMIGAGLFGGLGIGASAWFQGAAGAAAADALAETGQGFGNYLMTIGIIETIAIFVMVFLMISVG
jgi:V/A-type H+-transporting ATPase subunit K